jgi:chemotaxis protein histidine kinase CheA
MDDVEEALRQFRDLFVRTASERAGEMETLLADLREAPGDAAPLASLERHFHGLVGTGGTYGFPRVSELAAEGELDCQGVLQRSSAPSSEQLERWGLLVAEIRLALGGAAPSS